jgi:predicted PurR-regulated permease PerM
MAQLKHNQISASTLIEVVIAMVIILVVFALATSIFSGVLHSTPNIRQTYINSIADSIINNTEDHRETDDLLIGDSLIFTRKIIPFEGYSNLFKVTVQADDHGRASGVFSGIVKIKTDDK